MTESAPLREDIIDAVFRPVIGFFAGIALGYMAQAAEVTGWVVAVSLTAFFAFLAIAAVWLYERLDRLLNWLFEVTGLGAAPRKQLAARPVRRKHWFARFGWMFGTALGLLLAYLWPETALAWL